MPININKQTKISYQEWKDNGRDDPWTTFSNVTDAKNFYYTAGELAVFDTWCSKVQWAVINDDNGDATQLKVTVEFDAEPVGNAANWHSALDDLQSGTSTFFSDKGEAGLVIGIKESDDHLF